jgi:serine/threonine-protein kinase
MALAPSRLAEFKLGKPLGSGSTAKVFEAVHIASGSPVAIKLLEAGAQSSAELKERLAREAVMLAGLTSRHVAQILGFGYEKDQPFLVLERLHGETLDEYMKRDGTPPQPRLFEWIEHLLIGVRDCHQAGVIHRDIKPGNIFLVQNEGNVLVKLIDFGVARIREIASVGVSLTSTNHLIGSMGYMAPEQFQNARGVGPAADLYAVGVVLFRGVCGRLPFLHKSLEKVIKMKCEQDPPLLSSVARVAHHALLDAFVATALARNPAHRFQTAREMLEEWHRVVRALNDAPLTVDGASIDVVFDDENLVTTLVDATPNGRLHDSHPTDLHGPAPSTTQPLTGFVPPTQPSPVAPYSPYLADMPTSPDNLSIQEILQEELQRARSGKKSR